MFKCLIPGLDPGSLSGCGAIHGWRPRLGGRGS